MIGWWVLFAANNIFVYDLATQRDERRLADDGSPKILNGRLDWVYQEELYGHRSFLKLAGGVLIPISSGSLRGG